MFDSYAPTRRELAAETAQEEFENWCEAKGLDPESEEAIEEYSEHFRN